MRVRIKDGKGKYGGWQGRVISVFTLVLDDTKDDPRKLYYVQPYKRPDGTYSDPDTEPYRDYDGSELQVVVGWWKV